MKLLKANTGIISCLLSILIFSGLIFKPASATDASLLPNAVQQFFSSSGAPLASGKVYFYEVGTSTFKSVYNSSAATTPYTNPITLTAGGKPPGSSGIYGIGLYRQLVKDSVGNVVWDAVTAPGGGGSTPTNVGDGNLVGTILPWSGLTAPNQYVFSYGQELVRATYPDFFTAVTLQSNVSCTSTSNILTGIADTTQIRVGAPVELSLCVIAGTTVSSKTASTVTLSNPSSVSINAVATFFPYGNGNGTTTFNTPDLRGQVIAGRPNMGGSASSNLTATYCATPGLGATCGSQSSTISQSNLPNIIPTFTGTNATIGAGLSPLVSAGTQVTTTGSGGFSGNVSAGFSYTPGGSISSINGNVAQTAMANVQPTMELNYVIKVTPDTSASTATGVASLGGMTGVISCGSGLLCSGNTVSVNTGIFSNQAANLVFAGPASGAATAPAFRSIVYNDLPVGARPGTVIVNSVGAGAYTAYAPDGTVICTTSTTKCFQEGITYAQTNHYNFKANCANNNAFLSFTGPLAFGPGTSILYDLTGCSVAFSGFAGDAITVDTLNQGSHLKWTGGYITSTATGGSAVITFNPHTPAPGGGTAFQGSRVDFPYVLAGATVSRGVVFFETVVSTYSIANGNVFTFSLIDGNAGGFFAPACIVVENPPNVNNAFAQNIINFTSCQNPSTTGIKIGTTTPTGVLGTNVWQGMIGVGTNQTFGIETFGILDQFYLLSVSVNAGSLTTGIIFRAGANNNYIIAPQMEGTTPVNDGGTGNCGVINAKQKSCGSSW